MMDSAARLGRRFTALLFLVACFLGPSFAVAQNFNPDHVVRAELLPGWQTRDGTRMAALRLRLAPGWKTYWRAPGDAGIPPSFNWEGSTNMARVATHWPRPQVFTAGGLRSVGYSGEVILPMEFHPERQGGPIDIRAVVHLGVCEDICVPISLTLSGTLDGKGKSDPTIHAALADRPLTSKRGGVKSAHCALVPISDGLQLTAEIAVPKIGRTEVAVVEAGDARIWVSEAKVSRQGGVMTLVADLVPPRGTPVAIDRKDLRFTLIGDRQAIDVQGCIAH